MTKATTSKLTTVSQLFKVVLSCTPNATSALSPIVTANATKSM